MPLRITQIRCVISFLFVLIASPIAFADEKNSQSGFLDFNLYPYLSDVDSDNTFTLNIATNLSNDLSYFSLTNFGNSQGDSELEDTNTYYSEHNLRWQFSKELPFDLTLQSNFRTGDDNDRHRLGVRWRASQTKSLESFFKSINMSYAVNLHAIQFDDDPADVWQLEHAFMVKFPSISERLYLAGFIDHTFNETLPSQFKSSPIVAEAQLGFNVVQNFYVIAEYRINQYRLSDTNNFAMGFQYKMIW